MMMLIKKPAQVISYHFLSLHCTPGTAPSTLCAHLMLTTKFRMVRHYRHSRGEDPKTERVMCSLSLV